MQALGFEIGAGLGVTHVVNVSQLIGQGAFCAVNFGCSGDECSIFTVCTYQTWIWVTFCDPATQ